MKVIPLKLEERDHVMIKARAALQGKTLSQYAIEKLLEDAPARGERKFGQLAGQINLPDDFFDEDPEITALFNGAEK